ncbi:hypothetical protein, conserved [Trypanosoma brucei gambiense DAL972]|uniref:Uncharacterized protein n=1 Tax=Trypanosoma brucei gambiense (strain MHOM/CI/86/DAL972) TaxID=679716 RepID=C9ZHW0_TRYB9|nr:hypothetical protein, conserved [Trypanosoma brucei gambiense DAL972]CBH08831.1 hypothetical protein, conserved [Trypanosoma brucei gambiense DAL972]|eukprot:XP_011771272.1 hypothetical protein, conserved [Trypanosoma brucei gambiense DAL972]
MEPVDGAAGVGGIWTAIDAFVACGSSEAGVFLRNVLREAARSSVITTTSPPLSMLADACARFNTNGIPLSTLLLVAILNRIFCMQDVAAALALPVNGGRSSISNDLLPFYKSYLDASIGLPESVKSQLYLCVSSLLVLQVSGMDVVEALLSQFGGTVPADEEGFRCFIKIFSGCMMVISDRRIPMGPVQRSKQRLRLQRNIHLLLMCAPSSTEELKCLCVTVSQAVTFLSECTLQDPQDTSPLFWKHLPTSSFWEAVIHHLRHGISGEEIISAACTVIRAVSHVDDSTFPLLMSALLAVSGTEGVTVPVLYTCRVIAAAMESSVETVVLNFDPDHALYRQLAHGAHVLEGILEQQVTLLANRVSAVATETEEIVLVVCEGLQVISQVLAPLPIPEMDPTDDPSDYDMIVEDIRYSNERKEHALHVLRDFFERCHASLLRWMKHVDDRDVCDIVDNLLSSDVDDFFVQYDELPIALFATYERLCSLLWRQPSSHCVPQCAELTVLASGGFLATSAWDVSLTYQSLVFSGSDSASKQQRLLRSSLLVPVVVRRHKDKWSAGETASVICSLVELLQWAVMCKIDVKCVASISEGLRNLQTSAEPTLMESLWLGLHLDCGEDKTARWSLASHLGSFLSPGLLPALLPFDDCTQLILISHSVGSVGDVWRAMGVLQRVEPDVAYAYMSADRIVSWLHNYISQGSVTTPQDRQVVAQYTETLGQWCAANPSHFRVAWRLSKPLGPEAAAEILADSLEMYFIRVIKDNSMSWLDEGDYFSPYVLDTLAQSGHAPRLLRVLKYVIRIPATCIGASDAPYRLQAVVRGGNTLLKGGRCTNESLLELFYEATVEYRRLIQSLVADVTYDLDEGDKREDNHEWLLAELSKLGRVAQLVFSLPEGVPQWLHEVRCAVDEFDVRRVLKGN